MKSLLTPLMCALLAAPAFAQEKPDTDNVPADQRIADLERRLDAMSRELESQKAGSTPCPRRRRRAASAWAPAPARSSGAIGPQHRRLRRVPL